MNDLSSINDEVTEVLRDLRIRIESSGFTLESVTIKVLGHVEGSYEWMTLTVRGISSTNDEHVHHYQRERASITVLRL